MSLGCERDELGNDFILSISEEIDVIQKTEMLLVGLALGKMNPEKLRLKLFTRLGWRQKRCCAGGSHCRQPEREGSDQAWLRRWCEIRASDVFGANFGQKSFSNSVPAEDFAG
jgi:hypothetical protein